MENTINSDEPVWGKTKLGISINAAGEIYPTGIRRRLATYLNGVLQLDSNIKPTISNEDWVKYQSIEVTKLEALNIVYKLINQ